MLALAFGACGDRDERTNVRPPAAGVPAAPADVQGIYRTIHQGLLQLRGDGEFVLILPAGQGPSAGRYQLEEGVLTVQTDKCGDAVGEYRIEVAGEQEAGKARLLFATIRDACGERDRALTLAPWVYANS